MTTVIEVRGRGGQVIERFRTDLHRIRIGRAFDNDLVVDDRYVSPHHISLVRTEDGWRVDDHDSVNGWRRVPHAGGDLLGSGDRIRLGHSVLAVYDASHAVSEAIKVNSAESFMTALGRRTVWPVVLVAALALQAGLGYLSSYHEFDPLVDLGEIVSDGLVIAGVAAFWALVGRLVRHRAAFLSHLSIWLIAMALISLDGRVMSFIAYNLNSAGLETALTTAADFAVFAAALWASLLLATGFNRLVRIATALAISGALYGFALVFEFSLDDYSDAPSYNGEVMQPQFRVAPTVDELRLLDRLTEVLDSADAEAAKLAERDAED